MATNTLKILKFPDPRLRTVAKKVTKFDKSLETLAKDMLEINRSTLRKYSFSISYLARLKLSM